jgi:hypothetical protein
MHANASSDISPVEQYERQLARESLRVWAWIRLCILLWSLAQSYAVADYALGQVLRVAYGPDAAATTAMIWFFSVPFAIGSGVLALAGAGRVGRRRLLFALIPWGITIAEATVLLWIAFR